MLINFLLAIILIAIAISALIMLDSAINFIEEGIRGTLRFTYRSRILTEYLLRAYLRYKKTINKGLAPNY